MSEITQARRRTSSPSDYERSRQLRRCLRLYARIKDARTITLDSLAEAFEVSTRTIRRDLYALEDAGYFVPPFRREDRDALSA